MFFMLCYALQEYRDRCILIIDSPYLRFLLPLAGVLRNLATLKQTAR